MSIVQRTVALAATTGLLAGLGLPAASAADEPQDVASSTLSAAAKINLGKAPCTKKPNLKGKKPGELLKAKELKVDGALLKGARMFRVLYTKANVDEKDVVAACGLVVVPKDPKKRKAEVVAWAHGTIGLHQSCEPSNNPEGFLGPTAGGIGAVSYGDGTHTTTGTARDGILQGLIRAGRMVTATDYYSGLGEPADAMQSYVLGVPAAAAVIDGARVGIQLAATLEKKGKDPTRWKMATWGHSQGGHAAFWAAQLAKDYLAATKRKREPRIDPVGVAAIAPAASFVADETSPPELNGYHLGDREMHDPATFIGGSPVGVVGPVLFSLLVTAWDGYPDTGTLSPSAKLPGYPTDVQRPRLEDILTGPAQGNGAAVARDIASECLGVSAGFKSQPYNTPEVNGFFVQPLWGGPAPDGQWRGALDTTCADAAAAPQFKAWCRWLTYNMPGPQGTNPFTKVPQRADGSGADILIVQGLDDNTIWCKEPSGRLPEGRDCISRQLYDSLSPACADTTVRLDLYARTNVSPASHGSVTGQIADNGKQRFKGSRLAKFFNGAFGDTLADGCRAAVVNE
jgi:hypothetical protein